METRDKAIVALTPAADHSEKEGYAVTNALGVATVSAAATDVPFGLILDGEDTDGKDSVAVFGGNVGPCKVKLSGTVAEGDTIQLHTDGTFIVDAAAGARVVCGRMLEAGVATELREAVLFTPVKYT
ncbi:MAG: hypothetical protein HY343_08660 [Lentisphaerae bacterium]|nr:hypothetical protein [Lentisphaerota bacterium]